MQETQSRKVLGIKSSWWKAVFLALVFAGAILTIILAGNVSPQNIKVVDGLDYLGPIYQEAPNATIGYADSLTGWTISGAHLNSSDGRMTVTGTFGPSSNPSSAQISKPVFVNLTEYPIIYVRINVSAGVGYGIRAYSTTDKGQSIPLWNNSDSLDHRQGTGQTETIQLNMQALSKINTGVVASNVTSLQIYVERVAEATTTNFTLALSTLEFVGYDLTPFQPEQTYHSVYFTFGGLPDEGPSWTLNKINLGLQLSGSSGTSYEIFQLNGTTALGAQVFLYTPSISSYQYTLYPSGTPQIFSDTLPPGGGYALAIVSLTGALSQVKLQSASFVFTPIQSPAQQSASAASSYGAYWYLYLVVFLFLLPLAVALLIYDEFRREKLKPSHIAIAIAVGVICRFALAPVTLHPLDMNVYATSARGWFEYGISDTSLGPTLPFTFSLYWVSYSFYALLLKFGFHDFYILGHQIGFFESIFLKGFPIVSDLAIFYMLMKFDSGKSGKMLAIFYLLNPLSIYVSSVWGQYEAGTIAFVVLGLLFISRAGEGRAGAPRQDLKASLAFVFSALIEIVGLIPLIFLLVRMLFARPFKLQYFLLVLSPLALLFVYPPESHLIYLIFAGSVGLSSTLLLGQAHTPYTLASYFPRVEAYHPLVVLMVALGVIFLARRKFELKDIVSYTMAAFVIFLLFSAQLPQWWLFLLPLALIYAITSKKFGMGVYMLAFGSVASFLILSFSQGSGYMLFGSAKFNVIPLIEDARNGIDIYAATTTVCAVILLGYLASRGGISGHHTLIRTTLIILGTLLFSYFWFSLLGVNL